jgi:hypothetical protein
MTTIRWIGSSLELLTGQEMYRADAVAVERGIASPDLMERVGPALGRIAPTRWSF